MTQMIYKHPGKHSIHGDNFEYKIVDEDKVENELKKGWYKTTDEAKAGSEKPKKKKRGRGPAKPKDLDDNESKNLIKDNKTNIDESDIIGDVTDLSEDNK